MGTRDENNKREDRATRRASPAARRPQKQTRVRSRWQNLIDQWKVIKLTRVQRESEYNCDAWIKTSNKLPTAEWDLNGTSEREAKQGEFGPWRCDKGFESTVIIGQGRRGFLQWKFFVSLVLWERHLALLLSSSFWLPFAELTHTSGSILLRGEGKLLDRSHSTRNNFLVIFLVLISFLFSWFLEAGLFLVFWMSDSGSIFFLLLSWIADLRYQRGIAWCIAFLSLVVLLSLLHSTAA